MTAAGGILADIPQRPGMDETLDQISRRCGSREGMR